MTEEEFNELVKKADVSFESIKTPSIKDFVIRSLMEYNISAKKLKESGRVINVMMGMFTKLHQVNADCTPLWTEVLISAAYLHNLFYDGTLLSLFKAREKLMPIAKECVVPINASSAIFQAIEGQLGADTPVESCIPHEGTPNAVFAWSCWFVEELNGNKKMPECGAF